MRCLRTGVWICTALLAADLVCTRGQSPEGVQANLGRGELESIRASLEQKLLRDQADKRARIQLVEVLIRLARWADAEQQVEIMSKQSPEDAEPVFLSALIAFRRGDPHRASDLASRCILLGDVRPEVYKILALSEYLLGQTEKIEKHVLAILQKNPFDAEAQFFLARYLYEMGRFAEALSTFQKVLQIEPEHYKAHYYAGLIYASTDEKQRAREEFLASIKIIESGKIHYAWPFADLGRELNDAGESDRAITWLTRGIQNDPSCPKAYYEYARALFEKGAEPQVKQALTEAIRLDAGYANAYYLLARYYRKSGETQLADEALGKFRELKAHPIPSPYGLRR